MCDKNQLRKNGRMFFYAREDISTGEKIEALQKILIDGAEINSPDRNDNNNTVLHIAVENDEINIVQFLIKMGALLSYNLYNKTPMDIAKENNTALSKEIVYILTECGKYSPGVKDSIMKKQQIPSNQNNSVPYSNSSKTFFYEKRSGTSGVGGQFYETKLLSLVLHRALHDKIIEECYLAANIKNIGDFDDVCFRFKMKEDGETKHVMCFMQAKHKEDPGKAKLSVASVRSTLGPFSLTKYFDSFLKIKQKFITTTKTTDPMFEGEFKDIDCYFILYTPLEQDFARKLNNKSVCEKLHDFIYTWKKKEDNLPPSASSLKRKELLQNKLKKEIFQFDYENSDIIFLTKFVQRERMKVLGKVLLTFILSDNTKDMMTNDLIQIYHPALAQNVIEMFKNTGTNHVTTSLLSPLGNTGVQPSDWYGKFREEFFNTEDQLLLTLKETLYQEVLFTRKNYKNQNSYQLSIEEVKQKIKAIIKNPSDKTISKLIGDVILFDDKTNKLYLDNISRKKYASDDIRKINDDLQKTQVTLAMVKGAIDIAGKERLTLLVFQLPNKFGNRDFPSNTENTQKNIKKNKKEEKVTQESSCTSDTKFSTTPEHIQQNTQKTMEKSKKEKVPREIFFAEKFVLLIKDRKRQLEEERKKNNVKEIEYPIIIDISNDNVGTKKILNLSHLDTNGIGGTVGNLLQYDTLTHMFIFNTKEDSLEKNAKYMLQEIKKQLKNDDLTNYRINVQMSNFPRIDFNVNQNDINLANEFLGKLWFYTNQAQEEGVERILKDEIDDHYNADKHQNQFLFRVHSDAIFLRFHDEIQKWWKSQSRVHYLTKTDPIFDKAMRDIIDTPVLTVLNVMFIRTLKQFDVEFDVDIIQSMNLDKMIENHKILNIVSDAVILSATKIMQLVMCKTNYTFINLDYVNILPKNDYNKMILELKEMSEGMQRKESKQKNTVTLVILSETSENEQLQIILKNIIKFFIGKVIVITDKPLQVTSEKSNQNFDIIAFKDENLNLNDLNIKSQTNVLNEFKVSYQGQKVTLNTLIDESSKSFIRAKLLWSILNKSIIEIGHSLSTHKYDEIKYNYINRSILYEGEEYAVNTLNDIDEKIVLITSTPCTGKTILLTHLSLETKKIDPQPWIVRINMSAHSNDFAEWPDKNIHITNIMRYLCKAALKKTDGIKNLNFTEVTNETIDVNSDNPDDISFELKCFINFYNNNKIIFLFEGFEGIFARHTKEGVELFKALKRANKRMWITSNCYVINILESELGTSSFKLDKLSTMQQESFLNSFWKTNLQLEKLNHEQFNNINLFFNYIMKTFNAKSDLFTQERPMVPLLSIPLHLVYITAVEYFKNEINNISPIFLRETIKRKWGLNSYTAMDRYLRRPVEEESLELAGTPLHMYIAANYFELQIKDKFDLHLKSEEIFNKLTVYKNTVQLYERFLKVNLKHICETESRQIQLASQDKIRDNFLEIHKKLALFAICRESDLPKLLTEQEIREARNIIKKIETGEIRTNLIDCVVDGIPRFYNYIFAEYFLIELLSDILKHLVNRNAENIQLESLWDFVVNVIILCCPPGVRNAFEYKLKYDPELAKAVSNEKCDKILFDLILKQNHRAEISGRHNETSLNIAINEGLVNITNLFLKCARRYIDCDNLDGFLSALKSSAVMLGAAKPSWKELTDNVLHCIQDVDGEKLMKILQSNKIEDVSRSLNSLCSNTEFGKNLHKKIKSEVCEPIKLVADTMVALSSNNPNLATLMEILPYHLPESVNWIFGKK